MKYPTQYISNMDAMTIFKYLCFLDVDLKEKKTKSNRNNNFNVRINYCKDYKMHLSA